MSDAIMQDLKVSKLTLTVSKVLYYYIFSYRVISDFKDTFFVLSLLFHKFFLSSFLNTFRFLQKKYIFNLHNSWLAFFFFLNSQSNRNYELRIWLLNCAPLPKTVWGKKHSLHVVYQATCKVFSCPRNVNQGYHFPQFQALKTR